MEPRCFLISTLTLFVVLLFKFLAHLCEFLLFIFLAPLVCSSLIYFPRSPKKKYATRAWIKEAGRMNHLSLSLSLSLSLDSTACPRGCTTQSPCAHRKNTLARFMMCCIFFSPSMEDGADSLCVEFTHYFFHAGEFHSKVQ